MKENLNHSIKRLIALISDIFISINIYSFFHALGAFENLEKIIGYPWIILVGNYFAFRICSNFFIGASLSQYILGLRGKGGVIWKRVGGMLRSIYEIPSIILFPFTEFPILFGKKTLKEFFSQTSIFSKKPGFPFFGLFIFLPLTFFSVLISPIFENLLKEIPPFSPNVIKLVQKENKPQDIYKIPQVGLSTYSDLFKNRLVIIPTYKITKWGDANKYQLQYIVYDKILKRSLVFYFEPGPDLLSWIDTAKFLNPTFGYFYPYLDKLKKDSFNILSKSESEEFEILIENVLTFNRKKPFDYFLNNGPFLKGFTDLSSIISEKFHPEKIEKTKLGNKSFLTFKNFKNGKTYETFIPLYSKKLFSLKLVHSSDNQFRNDFLSVFFYFANWDIPIQSKGFYLSKNGEDFKKFSYNSLKENSEEAISLGDPFYLESVLDGLEGHIFISQFKTFLALDNDMIEVLKKEKKIILEKTYALKGK